MKDSVEKIMQRNIPAVDATESVSTISRITKEKNFHYVPVMLNGRLMGIINSMDLNHLNRILKNKYANADLTTASHTMRLYQILLDDPIVVSPYDSIEEVARIFSKQNLPALPVVDQGKFVGIVTVNDILKYFLSDN